MLPAAEASSVDKPAAIAVQNLLSSLRPAVGGLPGEGNGALPERSDRRFHLVIVAPREALRRPLESALAAAIGMMQQRIRLARRQIAMTRASVTSCAVIAVFIDQPTTR